jgi:hypothetical protein
MVTVDNMGTTGIAFKAGAGFLGLGIVSDTGTLNAMTPPYAWWVPRQVDGAGSKRAPEQAAGIADPQQYLRDHLAPLRAAQPRPLRPAPPGATDVRLYRVFIDTAQTALRLVGTTTSSQPSVRPDQGPETTDDGASGESVQQPGG